MIVFDKNQLAVVEKTFDTPLVTALGNTDGGRRADILAFHGAAGNTYAALFLNGVFVGNVIINQVLDASCAVIIPFKDGLLSILVYTNGILVALVYTGREIWRTQLSSGDDIRALEDARVNGDDFLLAANHAGTVGMFNSRGQQRWTYQLGESLHRLRTYDLNNDGMSEILLGGEAGTLVKLNAAEGAAILSMPLGQPITEIRAVELGG